MPSPVPAPVRPRIISPETGVNLPLEDEVRLWLEQGRSGVWRLIGGPGSGKTTALAHLAAVLPGVKRLRLVDGDRQTLVSAEHAADQLVIWARTTPASEEGEPAVPLVPWGRDEFIEYLLAAHPRQCANVMQRVSEDDARAFNGVPAVWRVILDQLTADPSLPDSREALLKHLRTRIAGAKRWKLLQSDCLRLLIKEGGGIAKFSMKWRMRLDDDVVRLLRNADVRLLLAAESLAADLHAKRNDCPLAWQMPREFVQAVAARIGSDESSIARLRSGLRSKLEQPMVASLLHAVDPDWVVPAGRSLNLTGAYLQGVCWPEIKLSNPHLRNADLSGADLRNAILDEAIAEGADLSGANLTGASLWRVIASFADFSDADLSSVRAADARFAGTKFVGACLDDAKLTHANLASADLSGARLQRAVLAKAHLACAKIAGADFTGADLTGATLSGLGLREACFAGACLRQADLSKCDLEGMQLDGIDLSSANLKGALLTDSSMVGGNLSGACLHNAGLADVNWEGADLSHADFDGATFHMGSSRSGLIFTAIPSEGSRTGFYTDDYNEQDFKAPEEIRKANLCRTDLRGASVEGTDFYLVDLRGARYDAHQERHFRRTGAILQDRCGG